MRFQLFSVFDAKARVYLAPFVARSAVDAKRQLEAAKADSSFMQTPVGQHPEDFELYQVGTFDDETGELEAHHGFVVHMNDIVTSTVRS